MAQFVLKCQRCSRPKPQATLDTTLLESQGWVWILMFNAHRVPSLWELRCDKCKSKDPPAKEQKKAA